MYDVIRRSDSRLFWALPLAAGIALLLFIWMQMLIARPSVSPLHPTVDVDIRSRVDVVELAPPTPADPNPLVPEPPPLPEGRPLPLIEPLPSGPVVPNRVSTSVGFPSVVGQPGIGLAPPTELLQPDTQPAPMAPLRPVYPPRELRNNVEGWVEVRYTVGAHGMIVGEVEVLRAKPRGRFDSSVRRALSDARFRPAQRDGKAVDATVVQRIDFKIED